MTEQDTPKMTYETYHFTCSKCGNDIATKSDAWNDNFCSDCGADMRGVSE
jgi:transcription initiation factor IIE alpha subunit